MERTTVLPLRLWRLRRGLSQRALAEAAGLTRRQVVRLEAGASRGWPATWRKLADALGVEPEHIAEWRKAAGLDAGDGGAGSGSPAPGPDSPAEPSAA